MTSNAHPPRFNFNTMSGVYPGTRTQVFQRVLLASRRRGAEVAEGAERTAEKSVGVGAETDVTDDAAVAGEKDSGAGEVWALIYWYEEPSSCVVRIEGQAPAEGAAIRIAQPLAEAGDTALIGRLDAEIGAWGYRPVICGTCHHWGSGLGATVDGLPLGVCGLRRAAGASSDRPDEQSGDLPVEIPLMLGAQSGLALGCPHWTETVEDSAGGAPDSMLALLPLSKVAEISESKMKPVRRWRRQFGRWLKPAKVAPTLAESLLERSGVGAGTESCPCCQGRIANLGALAAQDESGDKQTLSVWRCRVCHALYLSDWVDRWERVDSLETEETIYRVAPVEAAEMLTLIASVHEAEHPRRRLERGVERAWILAQVAGRRPVSHLVKQGR